MAQAAKIPVIDLSDADRDEKQTAQELVEAAIEHGFIYIRCSDIPVEAIDGAFCVSRELFACPLEEKQACTIQQNNRGWSSMQYETLDPKNQRVGDFKEAFNFGEFISSKAQQPIPPSIAHRESEISTFRDLCYHLSLKLTTLLGIGLGVTPPDFFTSAHLRSKGPSGTILRLLYYPPLSSTDASPSLDVRAGAHSDYGSLTMLFRLRGQAGLEVQTREGAWAAVPVCPAGTEGDAAPPILVNIGDLLSYWTGGLLRSTVHRVVFPGPRGSLIEGETDTEPRYSIAYFCHPVGTMPLAPVPSERVRAFIEGHGAGAEPEVMTADEHLQMRLRASYLQLYKDKDKGDDT